MIPIPNKKKIYYAKELAFARYENTNHRTEFIKTYYYPIKNLICLVEIIKFGRGVTNEFYYQDEDFPYAVTICEIPVNIWRSEKEFTFDVLDEESGIVEELIIKKKNYKLLYNWKDYKIMESVLNNG